MQDISRKKLVNTVCQRLTFEKLNIVFTYPEVFF